MTGLRFSKRIKIGPGIRLNLSKSGVSTSIGTRGATVTFGKDTRTTIGAPGTGLSHTVIHSDAPRQSSSAGSWVWVVILGVITIAGWPATWWLLLAMLAIVVYGFLKASPAEDAPREAFIPATAPKPPEAEHQRPALWLPLARTQLTAKADYASESEVSTVRRVDLGTMTCDCPDFARREEEYQPLDLRRLCKHLQRCVIENHRTDLPALHVALLEDVHLPRYTQIRFVHMLGHDVAFTTNDAGEWINVFARYRKKKDPPDVHTGRYIRYGYNPIEGRWAHGEAPANAPVFEVALAHS